MDATTPSELAAFLVATFGASAVAGLAGFAFGLVAAAVWLHILTPLQTTALIVVFGLLVQRLSVWRLRRALRFERLWPFLAGAALGVPLGAELLRGADPRVPRVVVGVFLLLYDLHGLARPRPFNVRGGGRGADGAVGFLSGVLGGTTGLAGILAVVWCGLRGWPKDEQRAVFQPVGVAIFAATALWLGARGAIDAATALLALLGLPAVLAGTWAGLRLYGRLDEAGFRRVVLALLMASGLVLLW
jgi:uncharacterized protein